MSDELAEEDDDLAKELSLLWMKAIRNPIIYSTMKIADQDLCNQIVIALKKSLQKGLIK